MRAIHVDRIAVLSRAAGLRRDVLDTVVDHLSAVVALLRAPHLNSVVGDIANGVARNDKAARVERVDRGAKRARDGRAGDVALDAFQHDAVAPRTDDLAIADRDPAPGRELNEAGILRQCLAAAVEGDAGEQDVVGAAANDQRCVVDRDESRCAGNADQPRAGRQHKPACAINAGAEDQRQPRARRAIDRTLQDLGLVVGTGGTDAQMEGIDAEARDRNASRGGAALGRDGFGCRKRTGCGGGGEEIAAIETHGDLTTETESRVGSRSRPRRLYRAGTASQG